MKKIIQTQNDEIDLLKIFWDGKFIIIVSSIIAVLIGASFNYYLPSSYKVTTPISIDNESLLFTVEPINGILNRISDNGYEDFSKKTSSIFARNFSKKDSNESLPNDSLPNDSLIFMQFIKEFNDYDELISILSKSDYVKQSIKNMNEAEKQRALLNFAKTFTLIPSKSKADGVISFVWHDANEGKQLLNDTLLLVTKNLEKTILKDIDALTASIDSLYSHNLKKYRNKLIRMQNIQAINNKIRIQFLNEQIAIAKELKIDSNQLDIELYDMSNMNYLRGYKALEKEIAIIKNRTPEDNLLRAAEYSWVKNAILLLESNLESFNLNNPLKTIDVNKLNDLIYFNMALSDSKSQKRTKIILALSMILGAIIGTLYILVSHALLKRKKSIKT